MAFTIQGLMLPNRELSTITVSATVDAVAANSIALYLGATVSESRQVEYFNAWKFLRDGLRDRDIFEQFAGIVYSGTDIDDIGEANRRTISTLATFTDNDVIIGASADVVIGFGFYNNIVDVAYATLAEKALELQMKAA